MENVITLPSTIGPPNAKRAPEVVTVPHGQGVIIDLCARGYDGKPLPNPEDHDHYLAISLTPEGDPIAEFHIGDPQVTLVDPATSKTRFRLTFADLSAYLDEGVTYVFNGWSQRIVPALEDPVRQVQGTFKFGPSVLGRRQPSFQLALDEFPDLLGPTGDLPYLIDLKARTRGGVLPIEYTATAGGIVNGTLVLSRDAAVNRAVTVTATDGRNDQEAASFQQITYAPLRFTGLADVIETQEAGGTVNVSLSVGFTGGYGNRVYETSRGTVAGSIVTLSLDELLDGQIAVTATDEDGNVVEGSFRFAVSEIAAPPEPTTYALTYEPDAVTWNGVALPADLITSEGVLVLGATSRSSRKLP